MATVHSQKVTLVFHDVNQDDSLARPLLEDLAHEYSSRYDHTHELMRQELFDYPADEFSPSGGGALVVATHNGVPVAGGAFRRYDDDTAELKRIWTEKYYRRMGLGKKVVDALESRAAAAGYRRIYLTTGWRQPEAVALYVAAGYQPQFDLTRYPVGDVPHPFTKVLPGEPRL